MKVSTHFETCKIAKNFGRTKALLNIDLQCLPGESIILLGPNGSGKTTLLKILALLMQPSSGLLCIDGEKTPIHSLHKKKIIGYCGHSPFLYQDLTVSENLLFFAKLYELAHPEKQVLSILQEFNIEDQCHRPVRTLSKGQQQRINLARVFLHHPLILILDEPYTHLDFKSSSLLTERLMKHRLEGGSLILSTHQIELGETIGTHWLILHGGEIFFQNQVKSTPPSEVVKIYKKMDSQ